MTTTHLPKGNTVKQFLVTRVVNGETVTLRIMAPSVRHVSRLADAAVAARLGK